MPPTRVLSGDALNLQRTADSNDTSIDSVFVVWLHDLPEAYGVWRCRCRRQHASADPL